MSRTRKAVVAITGASGSIYASRLLSKLNHLGQHIHDVAIVMSDNAKEVWLTELGNKAYEEFAFPKFAQHDFMAPFASGSSDFDTMIICPCSMGTLSRVAHGISNDLITRAADVMLKERRKLICVIRETPFSLIHIENMKLVTQAGGIICPANPSFYSRPLTFEQLADTVVDRVLDLCGLDVNPYRWGMSHSDSGD